MSGTCCCGCGDTPPAHCLRVEIERLQEENDRFRYALEAIVFSGRPDRTREVSARSLQCYAEIMLDEQPLDSPVEM